MTQQDAVDRYITNAEEELLWHDALFTAIQSTLALRVALNKELGREDPPHPDFSSREAQIEHIAKVVAHSTAMAAISTETLVEWLEWHRRMMAEARQRLTILTHLDEKSRGLLNNLSALHAADGGNVNPDLSRAAMKFCTWMRRSNDPNWYRTIRTILGVLLEPESSAILCTDERGRPSARLISYRPE